ARPRRPVGDARVGGPGGDAALDGGPAHDAGGGLGWPRRAALRRGPRGVPRSLLVPRRDARLEPDLSRAPPGGRRADRGRRPRRRVALASAPGGDGVADPERALGGGRGRARRALLARAARALARSPARRAGPRARSAG